VQLAAHYEQVVFVSLGKLRELNGLSGTAFGALSGLQRGLKITGSYPPSGIIRRLRKLLSENPLTS